eukprot:NODE_3009_length_1048_cov_21.210641_g2867_i0.p1 GENE.NODE_3009_length_1048_cov_21.210641_g2867_i0~~NODE_3009_length_1048_cov_21.210641_g2867_i0.p1  ORF type:complete len:319 (-),score=98.02 NODE_3009_length_1048_cov_21.210641_g2867_i0:91-984(-)
MDLNSRVATFLGRPTGVRVTILAALRALDSDTHPHIPPVVGLEVPPLNSLTSSTGYLSFLASHSANPYLLNTLVDTLGVDPLLSLLPTPSHSLGMDYLTLRQHQTQQHAHAQVLQGIAANRKQDYSTALGHYQAALDTCDTYVDAYLGRGAALANMGQYSEALEDFQTALRLDPGNANARKYMSAIHEKLNREAAEKAELAQRKRESERSSAIVNPAQADQLLWFVSNQYERIVRDGKTQHDLQLSERLAEERERLRVKMHEHQREWVDRKRKKKAHRKKHKKKTWGVHHFVCIEYL